MGTTSQKLNRILETKSDLKTVINYSGANITNETTFKDYPKLLNKAYIDILNDEGESLYNALPKTTGTGTSVNLDVEKGKMKIELNSSDLTQSGTPTPDNPQDIHVITGSNNIKISGGAEEQNYSITFSSKNLVNIPDITLSGVGYVINQSNLTIPNGTYTLSIQESPYSSFSVNIQDMNGTPYFNTAKTLPLTIEATNGIKVIRVYSTSSAGGTFGKIQLEEGSTATPYIPYIANPIEYCKIGSNEDQIFKNTTDSEFYDSTLELNEWYLKSNIDKTTLPTTDTTDRVWTKSGVNKNNTYIYTFKDRHLKVGSKVYSNMFLEYNATYLTNNNIYGCCYNTTGDGYPSIRVGMTLNGPSTMSAFKTWMDTNNPKFYYETVETKYTHISETDYPVLHQQLENMYNNAKSNDGVTQITQTNDDLPFNLKITALSKIE